MPWFIHEAESISAAEFPGLAARLLETARARFGRAPRRALLLPPDLTRMHSGAGRWTELLYQQLSAGCDTHVIPTLGQHQPHSEAENRVMFGTVPHARIHAHDWRRGVTRVGAIPARVVSELTGGRADWEIPVDLNRPLMEESWDLIVHIGHVVPHEVLGFASHNKNYFIGLGGKETISASHMASAAVGIENNLGREISPVRACFNWAEEHFLGRLPDVYLLLVLGLGAEGKLETRGVFVGDDLETYLAAARASARHNVTRLPQPLAKAVAFMQPDEFRSTWVANKAIYRIRKAMANGGELLVLAPGVERFGEQPEVDAMIRKYGYCGTPKAMAAYREDPVLHDLGLAAAHLMNGSSEGRFTIRYAAGKLSQKEVESIHFAWADAPAALARYPPSALSTGWNTLPDGEKIYFVNTPSLGLWTV